MIDRGVRGATTDPVALGVMRGSPPPPDKQIRFDDLSFMTHPNLRWSLSHRRELAPTAEVWRGPGPAAELPVSADPEIGGLVFAALDDPAALAETGVQGRGTATLTVADALDATFADAVVVLHAGRIVYERYWGEGGPHTAHAAFSITKSVTALLALQLVHDGVLGPDATVASLVPPLRDSGLADATVSDVLDMAVGVRFVEDYADFDSEVARYGAATNLVPASFTGADPAVGIHGFLTTLRREGRHGEDFHYVSPIADVLAWLITAATGATLAEALTETIWRHLGAEHDASVNVDRNGVPIAGTGLNATARDLARLGQLLCDGGRVGGGLGGRHVLSPGVLAEVGDDGGEPARARFAAAVERTGSHRLLRGWSYRRMFWHPGDADGSFYARGIYGQNLYVNPRAGVVIARYSSSPVASNDGEDALMVPMVSAIVDHLRSRPPGPRR